jgi:transposase-like protein
MFMTKSKMANRYSPEVRTRTVRMVFEHQGSYETQAGAIAAIAPKIGCIPQTVREWVKQAEKDSGLRDDVTTEERDRIKPLEREVRELCQANEILRKGEPLSANGPRIVCARIAIGSSAMKTVPTSEQFAPERLVMSSFERHAASRCGHPSPREMAGGPVAVWCRSFVSIMCSKGDELWAQEERMNSAKMRCELHGPAG